MWVWAWGCLWAACGLLVGARGCQFNPSPASAPTFIRFVHTERRTPPALPTPVPHLYALFICADL
eukprot:200420-Chlamydomonas_euryale.AAC.1